MLECFSIPLVQGDMKMKTVIVVLGLSLAVAPAFALKPCEELKAEIAAKLDAKSVKNYQLEIAGTADIKGQTVIGSCEAGAKKITYTRGDKASGNEAAKPEHEGKPTPAPKGD